MSKHIESSKIIPCPKPTSKDFINRVGFRFGNFRVISFHGVKIYFRGRRIYFWNCRCSCGKVVPISVSHLSAHNTRSCGCLGHSGLRRATHRMTGTSEHHTWAQIRTRCENSNSPDWPLYGGRGIKVCKRWSSFECFYFDMGDRPAGRSLDRKNNNGNYCKSNCRWATPSQQSKNRRTTRFLTFKGVTLCYREWERRLGLPKNVISRRIRSGFTISKALQKSSLQKQHENQN